MADYFTLTYDIGATLGVDPEGIDIVHAFVKTQYPGVVDTDTNQIKTGTWALEIDRETTSGSVSLPSSVDPAFTPGGHLFMVEIKYNDRPSGKVVIWRNGAPGDAFSMDADKDLADVVTIPVIEMTEAMRDEVFATAALLNTQTAATDGQVGTSLASRGLPTSGADLAATYVAKVPAPTGIAATDTANITNLANAAYAAGGGRLLFQEGQYEITAAGLPVLPRVVYEGVQPSIPQVNHVTGSYLADGDWTAAGGTVLHGTGTGPCFAKNTAAVIPIDDNYGDTEVPGAGFLKMVLSNFTDGIAVGGLNQMGLTWGVIDEIYCTDMSGWGVNLVNFAHLRIGRITTQKCATGGQRYATELPWNVFQPANSIIDDLYHKTPTDPSAKARRKAKGIVFESRNDGPGVYGSLGQLDVRRVQTNAYNRALLSVTATMTSGSADIAVPDGTEFAADMVCVFTSTVGGFTAGYAYVVLSVAGNNVQLGNLRGGAAIVPNASGTPTLQTYGQPGILIAGGTAASLIQGSRFGMVDSEGQSSCAVYLQGLRDVDLTMTAVPTAMNAGIVVRDSQNSLIHNRTQVDTDIDAASATVRYDGSRNTVRGRPGKGIYYDNFRKVHALSVGGGGNEQQGGDLQYRAQMLYPTNGMGERIYPRDSNITLTATNTGQVISTAAGAITYTLPTIVSDTGDWSASNLGAWFEVTVLGAGTVTVQTSGGQLLNKVSGLTSKAITTGQVFKFIAAKDNAGNLFWLARSLSPVTS